MNLRFLLLLLTLPAASMASAQSFRFRDVTADLGLADPLTAAFTHSVAWGDVDNDGRLDFFLGTFSDRNAKPYGRDKAPFHRLFRQTSTGKFEHVSSPPLELPARSSGAVLIDLDNDGDLDLYVSSNRWEIPIEDETRRLARDQGCRLYRNDAGTWVDTSEESGTCPLDLYKCRDIGVLDVDNDGLLDLLVLQDTIVKKDDRVLGTRLFRNQGMFRFEDVTTKAGLPRDLWGFGVALADLNGDGRLDVFVTGSDRLFLSGPNGTFQEAKSLQPILDHKGKDLDRTTGAFFGDLDLDGDMDLITGPHNYHGPNRVHVFLNEGLKDGLPRFREITRDLGIPEIPQKTPHPEIQDFDNDGIPDLYWSAFFVEGDKRWPFLCRGLGVKDGLPRFDVPAVPAFREEWLKKNVPSEKERSMIYYVNGPAVDFDGDGRLDLPCGNWPPAGNRFFRNETKAGHWLQVRVEGTKMNRMGIGARVRLLDGDRLLGQQYVQLNGGYSSTRPALVHFGLGNRTTCDVELTFPSGTSRLIKNTKANTILPVRE